jgi:hypothetical protein
MVRGSAGNASPLIIVDGGICYQGIRKWKGFVSAVSRLSLRRGAASFGKSHTPAPLNVITASRRESV